MYEIFADMHVHIGRSEKGKPIKITAARSLNFANIAKECVERKGINMVRNYRLCFTIHNRGYWGIFKNWRSLWNKGWRNYL